MKVPLNIVLFGALLLVIIEALTIFRYERLITALNRDMNKWQAVTDGVAAKKKYSAAEIIRLVRSSPEYLGDSITIFKDGKMKTSLGRFQGTISNVLDSKANMEAVYGLMSSNLLPFQYNVYILAARYYRQQYPDDTLIKALNH